MGGAGGVSDAIDTHTHTGRLGACGVANSPAPASLSHSLPFSATELLILTTLQSAHALMTR